MPETISTTVPMTVQAAPVASLSLPSFTLPPCTVGQPYSFQLPTPTGGQAPYTLAASGLPSGLSMSAGGLITGTPTAAGTGPVTFTVTDSSV